MNDFLLQTFCILQKDSHYNFKKQFTHKPSGNDKKIMYICIYIYIYIYIHTYIHTYIHVWASLVAQMIKNPPAMWETWVRYLGWEDSPGGGHGNSLQYSCLENPMDRGAWRATVHRVAQSRTRLK